MNFSSLARDRAAVLGEFHVGIEMKEGFWAKQKKPVEIYMSVRRFLFPKDKKGIKGFIGLIVVSDLNFEWGNLSFLFSYPLVSFSPFL